MLLSLIIIFVSCTFCFIAYKTLQIMIEDSKTEGYEECVRHIKNGYYIDTDRRMLIRIKELGPISVIERTEHD